MRNCVHGRFTTGIQYFGVIKSKTWRCYVLQTHSLWILTLWQIWNAGNRTNAYIYFVRVLNLRHQKIQSSQMDQRLLKKVVHLKESRHTKVYLLETYFFVLRFALSLYKFRRWINCRLKQVLYAETLLWSFIGRTIANALILIYLVDEKRIYIIILKWSSAWYRYILTVH